MTSDVPSCAVRIPSFNGAQQNRCGWYASAVPGNLLDEAGIKATTAPRNPCQDRGAEPRYWETTCHGLSSSRTTLVLASIVIQTDDYDMVKDAVCRQSFRHKILATKSSLSLQIKVDRAYFSKMRASKTNDRESCLGFRRYAFERRLKNVYVRS